MCVSLREHHDVTFVEYDAAAYTACLGTHKKLILTAILIKFLQKNTLRALLAWRGTFYFFLCCLLLYFNIYFVVHVVFYLQSRIKWIKTECLEMWTWPYQLKNITNVRMHRTLDVKRCHIFPLLAVGSASKSSRSFHVISTLLTLAAFKIIFLASSGLPLFSSHLGDSGINLKNIVRFSYCIQCKINDVSNDACDTFWYM